MSLKISDDCSTGYETFKKSKDTNFAIFTTSENDKNLLELSHQSNEGLEGLKNVLKEKYDDKVAFAVFRVNGVDIKGGAKSVRTKFVFVSFIGTKVPIRIKATTSVVSPQVKNFLGSIVQYSINVSGNDLESDLDMKNIGRMLMKAGGAHKPEYYDFGNDQTFKLDELY